MRRSGFLVPAFVLIVASPAAGQTPEGAVVSHPTDAAWTEIAPGVSFGAVYGDFMAEPHGKLVRFEAGLVSPPHTHTHPYHGIVIEGTVINPYEGEAEPVEMGPGAYFHVPGGAAHRTGCVSETPCLFWTWGDTAWDIQMIEEAPAGGR